MINNGFEKLPEGAPLLQSTRRSIVFFGARSFRLRLLGLQRAVS